MCSDIYGDIINEQTLTLNIDRKNVLYGGFSPVINNVYFTHGLIDPWRTMGIQTDLNNRSPADVIPGKFFVKVFCILIFIWFFF